MRKSNILKVSLLISWICFTIGIIIKINHRPGAEYFLYIAIAAQITFSVIALLEIFGSARISFFEKTMWLLTMLCAVSITSLIYLFSERKKVLEAST